MADDVAALLVQLWDVFVEEDATLVEVNPLVKTPTGEVLALDGKVTLDGNADFRHPPTPSSQTRPPPTRWRSRQRPRG